MARLDLQSASRDSRLISSDWDVEPGFDTQLAEEQLNKLISFVLNLPEGDDRAAMLQLKLSDVKRALLAGERASLWDGNELGQFVTSETECSQCTIKLSTAGPVVDRCQKCGELQHRSCLARGSYTVGNTYTVVPYACKDCRDVMSS